MELRTAQKLFLEKAEETRKKGFNKGLLIFATGLGKSLSAFADMIKFPGKLLILAHNESLLIQLANDFKLLCKDRKIGFMYKVRKDFDADVIFANVRTMKKYMNRYPKDYFQYILTDETHHAKAKTYICLFNYFTPEFWLGMTATPERPDKQEILPIYDNNIIMEVSEKEAMDKKWIRPYSIVALWDKWCDFNGLNGYYKGDGFFKYNVKEVGKKYLVPERIIGIIDLLKNGIDKGEFKFSGIGDLRGLYFCPRVIVAKRYCEEFNKAGIKSAYLEGKTLSNKREKIFKDFEEGKIQLIFNVNLIGEGMHIKGVDLVIMDRPTESFVLWNQAKGRQIFNIEGQTYEREGLLLDFVGNSKSEFRKYTYNINQKQYEKKDIKEIIENSIGVKCDFQPEIIEEFNRQLKDRLCNRLGWAIIQYEKIYGLNKPRRNQLRKENNWIYIHFLKNKLLDKYCLDSKYKDFNQAIQEFKRIYGEKKIGRKQLYDENSWIYRHFLKNKLLDKYCLKYRGHRNLNSAIQEFKRIYGDKKPRRGELYEENPWIYGCFFKNNLLDKYCLPPKNKNLTQTIQEFKRIYGEKKIGRSQLQKENDWIYSHFLRNKLLDKYCLSSELRNLKDAIKEFKKIYGDKKPRRGLLIKENIWIYNHLKGHNLLDKYCLESHHGKKISNIKISPYKPQTIILPIKKEKKGLHKTYEGLKTRGYSDRTTQEKDEIRPKIVKCVFNNDNVIALESPELSFIKELDKQGIKPKKVTIPNNKESFKLVNSLIDYGYKIQSNKEGIVELIKENSFPVCVINTDAITWLANTLEKYDFLWLDYCGAFSFYARDLDILFAKHLNNMKLILTYNLFDPIKDDENYYFTRVIDYVLNKVSGKSKVRLINDVTYRYKKNMYNLGFNIQKT